LAEERSAAVSDTIDLQPAEAPGFGCVPSLVDGGLLITFDGTGDVAAVELLSSYLKRVHTEVSRLALPEVVCDFRKLSFMNSSCFKAFVLWIDTVKNATPSYRIRFVTSPDLHWQKRSLEALRRLASDVVTVEA
jgi:hypothetical protein